MEDRIRKRVEGLVAQELSEEAMRLAVGEVIRDELKASNLPDVLVDALTKVYAGTLGVAELAAGAIGGRL